MDQAEFDRHADEYDAMLRESIGASGEDPEFFARYKVQDMLAVWTARRRDQPAARILDFGGGVGASLPHMADLFPDTEVVLADVSERSLEIAAARKIPNVVTRHLDGNTLPFEDGSFDMAVASCVFHHVPESEHVAIMREIRRVLSSKGLFFVFEHNPWNPLTRHAVNTCPFDENAVLITGRELRRRMKRAGFRDTDVTWRIFFPAALRGLRPAEKWLGWLPLGAQYRAVATG